MLMAIIILKINTCNHNIHPQAPKREGTLSSICLQSLLSSSAASMCQQRDRCCPRPLFTVIRWGEHHPVPITLPSPISMCTTVPSIHTVNIGQSSSHKIRPKSRAHSLLHIGAPCHGVSELLLSSHVDSGHGTHRPAQGRENQSKMGSQQMGNGPSSPPMLQAWVHLLPKMLVEARFRLSCLQPH